MSGSPKILAASSPPTVPVVAVLIPLPAPAPPGAALPALPLLPLVVRVAVTSFVVVLTDLLQGIQGEGSTWEE